ncbi:MAG: SMP-30/gluconolactonase/LRE family protein [Actinomycetota bacterium]|nr:MAG: gluconolactonase [Acidimicrobiaceae bacterium]
MSRVELLADGLRFAEGPRWHGGKLWFSDMYDHAVKTVDLDGRVETKIEIAGQPSGIGWLPDGTLLLVSMLDRSILRLEIDRLVVHADLRRVATWHCNDMVVDSVGRAYVGNFGFDLHAAETAGDFSAMTPAAMAVVERNGAVSVAAGDLLFPNGTVITADGSTLVVAESIGRRLTAFDRASDGTLSNRRVWADLPGRIPDGICLDETGAIWVANAAAPECIRVVEGGAIVDVIDTEQHCYACMLGGPEGTTLFMLTAGSAHPDATTTSRSGRILVSEVGSRHAGLP